MWESTTTQIGEEGTTTQRRRERAKTLKKVEEDTSPKEGRRQHRPKGEAGTQHDP